MKRVFGYLVAVLVILASWQLTAVLINSPALPTPLDSILMMQKNASQLALDFSISFYRVVIAMLIGTILAMPLGLIIGRTPKADVILAPLLYILYPIPKIVFLPVLLVLLGLADAPKILLIAITIFFQVLVTVRDAAKAVPDEAVLSVRSLGASKLGVFMNVVVPASLPELFTALRISSGTAIAILFFAETFAGNSGLGHFIVDSWGLLNYPRMFAGIIVMAFLGVLLYEIFDLAERKLMRWRKAQKA